MAQTFAELKKNRDEQLKKLSQKAAEGSQVFTEDERFWQPQVDKAGNGYAVIRFLPEPAGEDFPFVKIFNHGFKGPGGWYIENSLTTLGKDDPVTEFNSKLWNSTTDDKSPERQQARNQARRLSFISNILVVNDPQRPENNGKVFLFRYGKKIFNKLKEAMNPSFPDEKPFNPFDLDEGADFKLKISNVEGFRNYERSEFAEPAPVEGGDTKKQEAVWKQTHSLQAFLDASNFKSYDVLEAKLKRVLGLKNLSKDRNEEFDYEEKEATPIKTKISRAEDLDNEDSPPWKDDNGSDDESLEFFKKLVDK